MSILVIGGAGYIGSQISFMLSDNNIKHTVIDNLSTGNKKLINPKANFFKVDYGNKKQVVKILKKKKNRLHYSPCGINFCTRINEESS